MTTASSAVVPESVIVTPELLSRHGITTEEYHRILAALGRAPSLTELGIYSVMWSEHCSYKSSRVHLKRLPTKSDRVVQGPGENAGIIDVGDGWACAFKIESHNHPSYIEPFQGAATGVGGILRDIFTMGARPLAVMDSLRFGPIANEGCPVDSGCPTLGAVTAATEARVGSEAERRQLIHKNHSILEGVVSGIAGYGNCFGVPNLGGETKFEPCYSGNPLVNAFALGLVRKDEIFYAKASGTGNPVIYVGAKTGRDGIHGATMASEEFKEGSEQKRPNVQVGDPFMEKLLLEACLEAMKTGAIVGIQDMGAAGLTCSTCEMGARGGVGLDVELDRVPQRETGMSAYEIMLSESQERMLLVAEKGREDEVLRVFSKWGLDAVIIGTVEPEPRLRIRHHGELVADIPNASLTDDAPMYRRPIGEWKAPVPLDPPEEVLAELSKPRDYTADLKKLLASSNICSKRWIHEQYDSMVQTNTVQGPGGEAGVMRIKGTGNREQGTGTEGLGARDSGIGTPQSGKHEVSGHDFSRADKRREKEGALASDEPRPERGLAMALDGNGRWCYLDPKLGAMHAVAEAARKVACTGATPVAATNCLNFGNPEKPEIMAQLSAAIDGIAEACTALGTPITGGNVSLYNETRGVGIYPTPVVGIVGILDDVTKAVPSGFQREGDALLLLTLPSGPAGKKLYQQFGSSEFAKTIFGILWGVPPNLDLADERALHKCLETLAKSGLIHSAADISDGGLAVAVTEASIPHKLGAEVRLQTYTKDVEYPDTCRLFAEEAMQVLVTCDPKNVQAIKDVAEDFGFVTVIEIGRIGGDNVRISIGDRDLIHICVVDLVRSWSSSLESAIHEEARA
jgi:phosphoribosylformylglycinamidine synthase subunit PurL